MRNGMPSGLLNGVGLIQGTVAFLVIANLDVLNGLMPGGGFPWQMAPAAFMCWFVIGTSFFLWTDNAMVFLLVPGIALFGIQSYIETDTNFAISMSLFMVSVAVLLTRLHMRTMKGMAVWAGIRDFEMLYRGPWKAVAGPVLAVLSVTLISLASLIIAPGLGGAVRKLAGEPNIQFTPPNSSGTSGRNLDAAKRIGGGPVSASNMPVLEVTGDLSVTYLRSNFYGAYVGNGFASKRVGQSDIQELTAIGQTRHEDKKLRLYEVPQPTSQPATERNAITVKSLARRHDAAYVPPGPVLRFEYDRDIAVYGNDLVYLSDLFRPGNAYFVETARPLANPETLRAAPPTDRNRNLSRNTGPFADQVPTRVRDLANEAAARRSTDYDDVVEIIREIQRRAEYNLQAEAITGNADRIETFLFDTQEGYCDLFAASLTVMCRAIGLRARAVSGFLAPQEEEHDGKVIVRDRHAHMWTEVYFEGVGWVTFDATAGARFVPGGEVGATLDDTEETSAGAAFAAVIGGAIFGLSFVGLIIGGLWPRLKGMFAIRRVDRKVAAYYQDYLRALNFVLKRPKQIAETTVEYATAYASVRNTSAKSGDGYSAPKGEDEAVKIAYILDRALFSTSPMSDEEWANLRSRIAQLAKVSKRYARAN